jgi:hypothetical protein
VPKKVIDVHIRDHGVKGLTPFARLLPYWDTSTDHLFEYMHVQKNNGQRITDSLFGMDVTASTIQAMHDMEIHPNLTREVPDEPHWCFPAEIAPIAKAWANDLRVPRDWCNDHTMFGKCTLTSTPSLPGVHLVHTLFTSYSHPVHILCTSCSHHIHILCTSCSHPIHILYTS